MNNLKKFIEPLREAPATFSGCPPNLFRETCMDTPRKVVFLLLYWFCLSIVWLNYEKDTCFLVVVLFVCRARQVHGAEPLC